MSMPMGRRHVLLGLAHKGAVLLGWDEALRRSVQLKHTGHDSCKDMTDAQLLGWCWFLKGQGAEIGIPGPARQGGADFGRPSAAQWTEIERLAAVFGWDEGLDDARLLAFVRRTAKVDAVRFLMKQQATEVISGLRRWQKQQQEAVCI